LIILIPVIDYTVIVAALIVLFIICLLAIHWLSFNYVIMTHLSADCSVFWVTLLL